jgi:hypothetical protein
MMMMIMMMTIIIIIIGKDRLSRLVQGYDAGKTKYSMQKDANLIKQKHTTQKPAAKNIKNRFK